MHHRFTPSDLFDLSAEIVDCQFNITWILTEDGMSDSQDKEWILKLLHFILQYIWALLF